MPSPFPGMDPFLESQEWEDFHTRLITAFSERLSPKIEPDYLVRVERRVYVEAVGGEPFAGGSRQTSRHRRDGSA